MFSGDLNYFVILSHSFSEMFFTNQLWDIESQNPIRIEIKIPFYSNYITLHRIKQETSHAEAQLAKPGKADTKHIQQI